MAHNRYFTLYHVHRYIPNLGGRASRRNGKRKSCFTYVVHWFSSFVVCDSFLTMNGPVRVLYTINTSPQYILAKSPEKIPLASADDTLEADGMPVYGRAPLKTCALAICRSRCVVYRQSIP